MHRIFEDVHSAAAEATSGWVGGSLFAYEASAEGQELRDEGTAGPGKPLESLNQTIPEARPALPSVSSSVMQGYKFLFPTARGPWAKAIFYVALPMFQPVF